VLEETSRGDLRLVEIQVKVEICSVMTCYSTSLTVGPPIFAVLFHSSACFLALIYFVLLEAVTCPLLVEDIHSAIKKREGQQPDLGFAIFDKQPFGYVWQGRESAEQRAERAAPSVRKKRDLLLPKSVHPFYHRFDLTFVVLLCLENFREYILFCI
jgi:hypothetical protein